MCNECSTSSTCIAIEFRQPNHVHSYRLCVRFTGNRFVKINKQTRNIVWSQQNLHIRSTAAKRHTATVSDKTHRASSRTYFIEYGRRKTEREVINFRHQTSTKMNASPLHHFASRNGIQNWCDDEMFGEHRHTHTVHGMSAAEKVRRFEMGPRALVARTYIRSEWIASMTQTAVVRKH